MLRSLKEMLMCKRGSTMVEETDGDLLAAQAYEEMAAEKEGREPKDLMPKPEDDQEGDKQDLEDNIDVEEENQEEETSEEEQTGETEDKPEEESEETSETEEPEEEDLDTKIEKHAAKYEMTYAEAKEDIEKTEKIISQFKNDPKEMARALRSKDREYDKLKNELDKAKSKPKVPEMLTEDQFKYAAKQHFEADSEKYLNNYKKKYPAKSEILSDEAILEEIADIEWNNYKVNMKNVSAENSKKAVKVREEVIANIKESDKRFIPEVKAMLSEISDSDVIDSDVDFGYLLDIAKGKKFDEEIKAAEERGYKRAKEGAKILGVKKTPKSTKPSSSGSEPKVSLNENQKFRAEQMYSEADGYTPEQAYKMFAETFKDELKENPNFI